MPSTCCSRDGSDSKIRYIRGQRETGSSDEMRKRGGPCEGSLDCLESSNTCGSPLHRCGQCAFAGNFACHGVIVEFTNPESNETTTVRRYTGSLS